MTSLVEVLINLRRGVVTPVEICEKCLKMANLTKKLNAFVITNDNEARSQARESSRRFKTGKLLGILDGIPIAVKDNFNVIGLTTSCASKMLSNYIAPYTATVVDKLLNSGSILIGKTNMDEFAMGTGTVDSIYGPVKNPHNSEFDANSKLNKHAIVDDFNVCGGSSGGSAVAVATGTCFVALGSDTGGSVRSPAAMCGVVGLKPTYGLLSRHGLIPLVNSMDVPGILTNTVDDAALILGILAGHDTNDSTTVNTNFSSFKLDDEPNINGLRIGIPREFYCVQLSDEVLDAWNSVANLLEDGGADIVSVTLPHTQHSIACYSVLNSCEVASNFARYDGIEYGYRVENRDSTDSLYAASRHHALNDVVRERILAGNYFLLKRNYDNYFKKALKVRRLISKDYQQVFANDVDLLLTPVTLTEAPKYRDFICRHNREQVASQDYCTQPANMAGIPAISIPIQLSKNNLPISLQLISNHFEEKLLLSVAKYIERKVCFPKLNLINA